MTERKLIGIKCTEDKIFIAMKFMDCLEYRLLSDLPFQLPGTIRFTAENGKRIVWYHGENPHIRPDTHLTLKGRGIADDNALTPCGRSSLYDLLCDFVEKTDLYYFYSTGSGADCEWKESVFENGYPHHFCKHNHTDGRGINTSCVMICICTFPIRMQ